MRIIKPFNSDWYFRKDACTDWEAVSLPHTWNALDGQDGGDDYYQGVGWYRKQFSVPNDQYVYIRFGAASKMATVFCNQHEVGIHRGGFSAFTMDLTPYLQQGMNELLVKVDNTAALPIYPDQADFTFFGGLYRTAQLILFDSENHFNVDAFGTDALLLTPDVDAKTVRVSTICDGGDTLTVDIKDHFGSSVVSKSCAISSREVEMTLTLPQIHLWDGLDDPYVYTAQITMKKDGVIVDTLCDSFGFRKYQVTAESGFFLNGRYYPLHGVCRHQDRENKGWAITQREHLEDMALIREIGANTLRLAHYQQAPFFYSLCDQNGIIVWAEIPFVSVYLNETDGDENLRQQMRELILQNYNHPSICFWGVANEIGIGGESPAMYNIVRELNGICKQLDPTRPTIIANVGMTKPESPLFHITDLASYNEYKGWYEGTVEDHGEFCDDRHSQIPTVPLAISEYGAEAVLNWHSSTPKVKDYTEEYQAIVHEYAYRSFLDRTYIWATWAWNMFDFAVDGRDEGGCRGRNNKGLVTYDRKQKKQAFYFYKACWSKEPFVYICGERYTKRTSGPLTVKVYSNQTCVSLWVNGRNIGSQENGPIFLFPGVMLDKQFNEVLAVTDSGCRHALIWELVEKEPEEYVLKQEKQFSENVSQWFAHLIPPKEVVQREGYLSIYDSLEEVYRYPEGYSAIQELIVQPLRIDHPAQADRLVRGGALSFHSVWNHINRYLPDEAYQLVNDRLSRIQKIGN